MENYNAFFIVVITMMLLHISLICSYNFFTAHVPYKKYVCFFAVETIFLLGLMSAKIFASAEWLFSPGFWLSVVVMILIYVTYISLSPMVIVPEKKYIMTVTDNAYVPDYGLCLLGTIEEARFSFTVLLPEYPYAYELHHAVELTVKLRELSSDRKYYHTPVVMLA